MNKYDEWRSNYDQMSYADQIKYSMNFIGDDTLAETRHQLISDELRQFLINENRINHTHVIFELGGWKGYLANEILAQFDSSVIWDWYNFDIAIYAMIKTKCLDPRYNCCITNKPIWAFMNAISRRILKEADIFVASHVLEHIKFEELEMLYYRLLDSNCRHLFIDIPVPNENPNWSNYEGTHILEVGYNEIIKLFSQEYNLIKRNESFTLWGRNN